MKYLVIAVIAAGVAVSLAVAQTSPAPANAPASQPAKALSPVFPGAKPVKLADGFAFTEGATCDKDGNVCFVDQPNNRIMKWTFDADATSDNAKGKLSTFLQPSGYSNGMSFDKDDNLIACADEKNELWSISPLPAGMTETPAPPTATSAGSGHKITVLLKDYNGKPLNGPNDVWIRPESADPEYAKGAGGMYLTDAYFLRAWWKDRPGGNGVQQPGKYVYYFSPDHKTLTPVITNMRNPNGIIGTPDGKTLYVSDFDHNLTNVYKIAPDGTLSDEKLFCRTGSDGMTIDDEGYVYTTHYSNGLYIWDKNGKRVDAFPLSTGNVCFGGKNRDILFICAVKEIYALRMRTHGVGPS